MLHFSPPTLKADLKRFFDKPVIKRMLPVSKAHVKQFCRDWLILSTLVSAFGYYTVWKMVGLSTWPRTVVTVLPLYAALFALKFTFYKWWIVAAFKARRQRPLQNRPLPTNKRR